MAVGKMSTNLKVKVVIWRILIVSAGGMVSASLSVNKIPERWTWFVLGQVNNLGV